MLWLVANSVGASGIDADQRLLAGGLEAVFSGVVGVGVEPADRKGAAGFEHESDSSSSSPIAGARSLILYSTVSTSEAKSKRVRAPTVLDTAGLPAVKRCAGVAIFND